MRTPYIPQLGDTDCGPAALAAVVTAYGRHVSAAEISAACETGRDGTSLTVLRAGAARLGLDAVILRVRLDQDPVAALTAVGLPHIAMMSSRHFVVVEEVARGGVRVNDPARGRSRRPLEEFVADASGLALRLAPGAGFVPGGAPSSGPLRAWWHGEDPRARLRLVAAGTLGLLSALAGMAIIVALRSGHPGAGELLWAAAAAIAFGWGCSHLRSDVLTGSSQRRAGRFVGRLVRVTPTFLARRYVAEVAMRPQRVDGLATSMVNLVVEGVASALSGIVLLVALAWWSPAAAATALAAALLAWASTRLDGGRQADLVRAATADRQVRDGDIVATLRTMESLKAEGSTPAIAARLLAAQKTASDSEEAAHHHASRRLRVSAAIDTAGLVGVALLAGGGAVGSAMAVLLASLFLASFRRLVTAQYVDLTEAATSARLIDDVLDQPPRVAARHGVEAGLDLRGLAYRHASYRPWLFTGVDLTVAEGARAFLVGPSGVGKSTLARIVAGSLDASAGTVSRPVEVSYVPQRPVFLEGTVRDNLLFGAEATDADLRAVLALVELDRVVDLRGGLSAPVVQSGANFSGGERARLALARALLRAPRLLVLDEAFASLDDDLAERVYARLTRTGATILSVSHRLPRLLPDDVVVAVSAQGLRTLHPVPAAGAPAYDLPSLAPGHRLAPLPQRQEQP